MSKDGGSAFPSHSSMGEVTHEGKSLRDWFAGHAVAGIVSTVDFDNAEGFDPAVCAETAYRLADAMLAERVK